MVAVLRDGGSNLKGGKKMAVGVCTGKHSRISMWYSNTTRRRGGCGGVRVTCRCYWDVGDDDGSLHTSRRYCRDWPLEAGVLGPCHSTHH
jgi:hypothetical protein